MLRNILSVIIGYIVMGLLVMIWLTGAYLALGADRAFEAGTYDVTPVWMAVWAVSSIVAAVFGGIVCAKISRHSKGALIALVVLTGVLGAGNTIYRMNAEPLTPEQQVRTGDTPNTEAMMNAQAPTWMYIAEPLMGMVGLILGAKFLSGGRKNTAAE